MGKQSGKTRAPATRSRNGWVFPSVIVGIVLVGVLAVVLVAAGGDDGGRDRGATTEVAAEVSTSGAALPTFTGAAKDPAVGMDAPVLGSVDFDGRNVEVGGATGEPYALVFLAHWCPHCQNEVPRLVSVADAKRIEGVEVTGIATGTTETRPNYPPSEWLARAGWPFGEMADDSSWRAAAAYGLRTYPLLVFVDANGKVVGRTSGEIDAQDLRRIFRAVADGETDLPLPESGAASAG